MSRDGLEILGTDNGWILDYFDWRIVNFIFGMEGIDF